MKSSKRATWPQDVAGALGQRPPSGQKYLPPEFPWPYSPWLILSQKQDYRTQGGGEGETARYLYAERIETRKGGRRIYGESSPQELAQTIRKMLKKGQGELEESSVDMDRNPTQDTNAEQFLILLLLSPPPAERN
ncbi:hypothetical protein MLD38_020717 [Melastoma candidum]|uniref:Uncharacterized protein n=1 Tax=Melastoma candidum TaxID=119954 RepID=A0ACB9QLX1_9MYRT|nr:hypothetical protein MLD38_020717 [Melastoma candidum]